MSKEAALRAMREARYVARASTSAPARTARAATPATRPAVAPPTAKAAAAPAPAAAGDALCGHTSMNGRSCTREAGHAAKSHRYS